MDESELFDDAIRQRERVGVAHPHAAVELIETHGERQPCREHDANGRSTARGSGETIVLPPIATPESLAVSSVSRIWM